MPLLLNGYKKIQYIFEINTEKNKLIEKVINDSDTPFNKGDIEEILFSYKRDSIEEAVG